MMLGSQEYSCMRNHNLQCVTVVVAFGLRSDPFHMLHRPVSPAKIISHIIKKPLTSRDCSKLSTILCSIACYKNKLLDVDLESHTSRREKM